MSEVLRGLIGKEVIITLIDRHGAEGHFDDVLVTDVSGGWIVYRIGNGNVNYTNLAEVETITLKEAVSHR